MNVRSWEQDPPTRCCRQQRGGKLDVERSTVWIFGCGLFAQVKSESEEWYIFLRVSYRLWLLVCR